MSKYTVILRRDLAACDLLEIDFEDESTYIAFIETDGAKPMIEVVRLAKDEVFKADKKEAKAMGNSNRDHDASWYQVVCVLEGHPKVLVYDFQAKEYR